MGIGRGRLGRRAKLEEGQEEVVVADLRGLAHIIKVLHHLLLREGMMLGRVKQGRLLELVGQLRRLGVWPPTR